MKFERRFRVAAPRAAVVEFHQSAGSLKAITPPLTPMRLHDPPSRLVPGSQVSFTLWLGPFPMRWTARIEGHEGGFIDSQIEGPFASWRHTHTFVEIDAETTEIRDQIEARLPRSPLAALIALKIWLGLPVLFAYRRWKTRRELE